MKKIIYTNNAPQPIGPYSQAVLADDFLYISGQVPIDPTTGKLVEGGIKEQAEQVMKNLNVILLEAEMNMSHVVKTSIFTTDISKFSDINDVYARYFNDNFPARETIEVSKLPVGAAVEISMIAVKKT